MAVALFGTIGTGSGTNVDPLDHNHTIASGSSNVLLVAGTQFKGHSAVTLSEVRWDPATDNQLLTEDAEQESNDAYVAISHYTNPANQDDTAYTLRHDFSASPGSGTGQIGGGLNFSGVDQTTSISNATSETGASGNPNCTVTTNADADDIVTGSATGWGDLKTAADYNASGGETERWDISAGSGVNQVNGVQVTEGGGANPRELDWSDDAGTDNDWASCGMLINAAAAGGGGAPPGHGKLVAGERNKMVIH